MSRSTPRYASTAAVRRAITAVQKLGSRVNRIIYQPDGSFEIIVAANDDQTSEFDRLEAAGLL
jgi:hypothetical protein